MTFNFLTLRFTVPPNTAISFLPFNADRKYLLVACSSTSIAAILVLFYEYSGTNEILEKPDGLKIFSSGFYEPNIIPNNIISLQNPSTSAATGFILYA